jgi:hypothetical protein
MPWEDSDCHRFVIRPVLEILDKLPRQTYLLIVYEP